MECFLDLSAPERIELQHQEMHGMHFDCCGFFRVCEKIRFSLRVSLKREIFCFCLPSERIELGHKGIASGREARAERAQAQGHSDCPGLFAKSEKFNSLPFLCPLL